MSPFSVYHLGKISEKNLYNFFRFLLQAKDKYLYLSNNLMIHCDDPHRARTFIDYITKGIKTIDEYIKKLILENFAESDVENDSNDFTSHYMSEHDFKIFLKMILVDTMFLFYMTAVHNLCGTVILLNHLYRPVNRVLIHLRSSLLQNL